MKTKFQPAPWEVGVWTDVVKDYHDHPDGLTRGQFQVFPIPEDIQAEYYRRMFEAAPEMLAALKAVAEEGGLDRARFSPPDAERLADLVGKAIAKAEGQ